MTRPTRRALFQVLSSTAVGAGMGLSGCAGRQAPHLSGTAAALEPPRRHDAVTGLPFKPIAEVRIGLIGVGGRGSSLLRDLLGVPGARVTAICDVLADKAQAAEAKVKEAGQAPPALFTGDERAFEKLCRRDDVDLVVVATPWDWHVPMALEAMNNGKHVGVEVPAAVSIEECWRLVETSEATRRHCVMLENCCYGEEELLVLALVRDGVLGRLTHGEAGYIHDLRQQLFGTQGEGVWRRAEHTERDGNLYATHGLGPVASYMDINRGDRFDFLVSVSSPQLGFDAYRAQHIPKTSQKWRERYVNGDMNTSIIKTGLGRTIVLQHDTTSPRPYDRINLISGTKGAFRGYPARIFLDGQPEHEWTSTDAFKEKYTHPLWRRIGELARQRGGHGGMDFVMCYRLIECMQKGFVPDMDVYDAAAWSAAGALSTISVAGGSVPVRFPDFTRGHWQTDRRPFATETGPTSA